jgi:hypothetical protein
MLPNDIEKQAFLAEKIYRLAVGELAKKSITENAKSLTADIKARCGNNHGIDIKSLVASVVLGLENINKAKEALEVAEDAMQEANVLRKYFPKVNAADEAEKYLDGITNK